MTTVKNIYDYINSIAPFSQQEEWDNSGHIVGEFRKEVKKAVLALDSSLDVCNFAKSIGADLLITHHPIIFNPISSLKQDSPAFVCANAGVSVICAHTNFDVADCGINFNLAKILNLSNVHNITDSFIVVGDLENGMSIDDFVQFVSDKLQSNAIRYTDTDKIIKTVALGGGACDEYIDIACDNADCFLTGEAKYHIMLDAQQKGQCIISAGHYETENQPFLMLKDNLEKIFVDVEFVLAPWQNPIKNL